MDKIYNSPLGEIVIIKNIIFKEELNIKKEIDHAWICGRPCIIIYSDDEYDYYLTLTSSKAKKNYFNQIEDEYYTLNNKDFLYTNKDKKHKKVSGCIKLKHIYRKKISGYNIIGRVTESAYLEILKKFNAYHKRNIEEVIREERRR